MSNRNRAKKRRVTQTAVASRPAQQPPAQPKKQERARQAPRRDSTQGASIDRGALAGAGITALIAFVVYALTLEHSVPTGDSGELTTAAAVLGIPHPPGYPLYALVGHVAALLPGGSTAERLNLMSGFFDALAVGIVFLVVYGLATDGAAVARRWQAYVAGAVGALLLAFSSVFWAYSVQAEVFALNNFFGAVLLWIAIEWCRRPQRVKLLWLFMLLFGLALCDQQTIVLFLPAFVVLAVQGWRRLPGGRALRLTWKELGIAIGAFVVGLLPYLLYLPLAASQGPGLNWDDPTTPSRWWYDVFRGGYGTGTLITGAPSGSVGENLKLLFSNLVHGFVYAGLALAVAGLWWTWRNRKAEGIALATAFIVAGPIFMAYTHTGFADQLTKGILARFYILPCVPLAMLSGLGAWWVLRFVDGRSPARYARALGIAAAAALLVIPAAAAAAHYSANDFNDDSVELNYAKDLLAPLPQGSILLMRGDNNYTGVVYAQLVDHYRPDVIALDTELLKLGTYVNQAKQEHPSLLFPFAAYKPGTNTSQLNQFVRANLAQGHPVFVVGKQQETSFGKPFSTEYWGLTTRIEPKGSAPDPSAYEASSPKVFAALHWPTKVYPATSWESVIDQAYALAAFQFAVGVQQDDGASQAALIERMYQIAIKFDPTLAGAYKNYGYLLDNLKRDPALIASLWTKYLQLDPTDPQDATIRQELARIKAQSSSK